MKVAALFDLDQTLLAVNSGRLWVARERRLGRIGVRQLVEAALHLAAYRLSVIDIHASMRKALALYRGVREDDVDRWTREWFMDEVARHIAPGAWPVLAEHRQAGHLLVLLTSSSPYLAAIVARHLSLDHWISSTYEVKEGLFTGEPRLPICYGPGKVALAEAFSLASGVDLSRSYFYTDSFTDLPMLLRVGRPCVVNPDVRLWLYARARGWPVADWRSQGGAARPPGR